MSPPAPFAWLNKPAHRKWFATWLCGQWFRLDWNDPLPSGTEEDEWKVRLRIQRQRISTQKRQAQLLESTLPHQPADHQLAAFRKAARQCGLRLGAFATDSEVAELIRFELAHTGPRPAPSADVAQWKLRREVFLASPWQAERAQRQRRLDSLGLDLCARHYPSPPPNPCALNDTQLALNTVMRIFSAQAIETGPHPPSPAHTLMRRFYDLTIETGPNPQNPAQRHAQRALFDAIKWWGSTKDGPSKLARWLAVFFKEAWPLAPVGVNSEIAERDLARDFKGQARAAWIRKRFDLAPSQVTQEAKHLLPVVRAAVCDNNLRPALALLAYDARLRPKGWLHMRKALADALRFISKSPSQISKMTDFELHYITELPPEPDERLERFKKKLAPSLKTRSTDGTSSAAQLYSRGMEAAEKLVESS